LPRIRPTAGSGSSSLSFLVEYGLSDGIAPGRGERRHELVVADDRHVAGPDAERVVDPRAAVGLDLRGRRANLSGCPAGLHDPREEAGGAPRGRYVLADARVDGGEEVRRPGLPAGPVDGIGLDRQYLDAVDCERRRLRRLDLEPGGRPEWR
jgi:hypothetical protein